MARPTEPTSSPILGDLRQFEREVEQKATNITNTRLIAAERDRLKAVNDKLLAACKKAYDLLRLRYSVDELKDIDAAIAEAEKE